MTPDQRAVLEHSLGLDRARRPYRSHFAADPTTADGLTCRECVQAGWMTAGHVEQRCNTRDAWGEEITHEPLHFFYVTAAGAAALGVQLPK